MCRIKLASGQAAAKARRTRDAISMTRAPSFKSRRRMVLNSAVASRPVRPRKDASGGLVNGAEYTWVNATLAGSPA
jgi:hypothetical protein